MAQHRPNHNQPARVKLFEACDEGDHLQLLNERTDLDADSLLSDAKKTDTH